MKIKIAVDFSINTGGRYIKDGDFSGELFRDELLIPKLMEAIGKKEKLIIDFDGGYGYSPSFVEESFGGLIRKGLNYRDILSAIKIISFEDISLIDDINKYLKDEEEKNAK